MSNTSDQFPITNIPFGIISTDTSTSPRPATRIDSTVIDLSVLTRLGAFDSISQFDAATLRDAKTLNAFAAQPRAARRAVRERVQELWREMQERKEGSWGEALLEERRTRNHVPMQTVNYADYVSSLGHAVNVCAALSLSPPPCVMAMMEVGGGRCADDERKRYGEGGERAMGCWKKKYMLREKTT
ncbi:Fumarylacetoacetase [Phyllosticta citrichinensis]